MSDPMELVWPVYQSTIVASQGRDLFSQLRDGFRGSQGWDGRLITPDGWA